MPRNGSGGYTVPQNSWNPAINGAQALPADWMAILNDMVAAVQASIAADGQTPITGILNFQNNRISSVGAPIGEGNALRLQQIMKGDDVASATTIAFPIEGSFFEITGTTTITGISPAFMGRSVLVRFADSLTLTNGADFQLPGGANITTLAGDFAIFLCTDSVKWVCYMYQRKLSLGGLPIIPLADIPTTDIGQISVITKGTMEWDGTKYRAVAPDDLQWLGTPIGGYITPFEPPPTDDPRYRYVLCTAGEAGVGGYNEGVLTGESVTGSAPLIEATAIVDLAGSPFDTGPIHLINTERRFVGAGDIEALEDDSLQNFTGAFNIRALLGASFIDDLTGVFAGAAGSSKASAATAANTPSRDVTFDPSLVARTSDHTQPRTHRLPHYRRIL